MWQPYEGNQKKKVERNYLYVLDFCDNDVKDSFGSVMFQMCYGVKTLSDEAIGDP